MNSTMTKLFLAVVLLAVGLFVGRLIGVAEVYKKTTGSVANEHLRNASLNLNSHLGLLELLRAKQEGLATAKLERMLDVDLRELSRFSNEELRQQNPELPTLIDRAKQYRQHQ